MKISIILLFITFDCIYSLNEPKNVEFDVETVFDNITNNEFLFYYDYNTINPLIMKIIPKDKIPYDIYCEYPGFSAGINWNIIHYFAFIPTTKYSSRSYYIKIKEGKGTFIIHPINNTIKIDFSQQCYGIPENLYLWDYNGSMHYLVSNLKETITATFSYSNIYNKINPLKICHGIECVTGISKYKFEKGEEYTIEVKIKESCYNSKCNNYFESFSICNENILK